MPLEHLLAPLIARKKAELEAAIRPQGVGYLAPLNPHGGHNSREPLGGIHAPAGPPDEAARRANQALVDRRLQERGVPHGFADPDPNKATRAASQALVDRRLQERGVPHGFATPPTPPAAKPEPAGYLHNIADKRGAARAAKPGGKYEKTPYDPKGLVDKPAIGEYDPSTPVGSYLQAMGAAQRSPNAGWRAFARGMGDTLDLPERIAEGKVPRLIPNVPAPDASPLGEPVAFDEAGRPVYEDTTRPPARDKHGRIVIQMDPSEPVFDEAGRAVDRRGRALPGGYLQRDPNVHTLERSLAGAKGINAVPGDELDRTYFRQQYGEHLKAMQENRGPGGRPTDKLPDGYFEALGDQRGKPYKKAERKAILDGIKTLQSVEKEERELGGLPRAWRGERT